MEPASSSGSVLERNLSDADPVADLDHLRPFGGRVIDLDLASIDRLGGEPTRLVEASGPQPLVQSDALLRFVRHASECSRP